MKIYIVCTVRNATEEYRKKLEEHTKLLEDAGNEVYLPHRDTKQDDTGIKICNSNVDAICRADIIHVFYNRESQGTHFDLGAAFALKKEIIIVENEPYNEGKSFSRMLVEWENL